MRAPSLWPHVTLITSLKTLSPSIITLGVRALRWELVGDRIQSITDNRVKSNNAPHAVGCVNSPGWTPALPFAGPSPSPPASMLLLNFCLEATVRAVLTAQQALPSNVQVAHLPTSARSLLKSHLFRKVSTGHSPEFHHHHQHFIYPYHCLTIHFTTVSYSLPVSPIGTKAPWGQGVLFVHSFSFSA